MIIRRKLYSEEDNSKAERTGEAIGTAALGVGGSLVAGKYAGKIAKNAAIGKESERAVKEYRKGAKELLNKKTAADRSAADNLAGFKEGNKKSFIFGRKKRARKAEEAFQAKLANNKSTYEAAMKKLRGNVVANKNKNISKAAKRGKIGAIATGLGLTAIAAGSKLRKKKDNNYDPKPGEIIK